RAAGAVGLIVTLVLTFFPARDWGSTIIPGRIGARAALRYGPSVLRRPRWLAAWAKTKALPDLSVPNWVPAGEPAPTLFGAYGEWMMTPPPSWADLRWLRGERVGRFRLKGIFRFDDAKG